MDKGVIYLRKIQESRYAKISEYEQFLNKLFPNDIEYIKETVEELKVLLILDIPGFSQKENRERRVELSATERELRKLRHDKVSIEMWKVYSAYKKKIGSLKKSEGTRMCLIKQLRKMHIWGLNCRVSSFNHETNENIFKIEFMTLDDFLSVYSLRKIEKFIDKISEEKWSVQTKNQALKQFRHFWSFIHEEFLGEKIRHGNTKKSLGRVIRRPTNRFLDAISVAALFEEIEKSDNVRNIILCRLLFYCGKNVTYEEISEMQVSQIDFEKKQILFSSNFHIIFLDEFSFLLKNYITKNGKYVFRTKNNTPISRNYLERFIQAKAKKIDVGSVSMETLQLSRQYITAFPF